VANDDVPEGFVLSERTGPFFDLIGPIYTGDDERGVLLGLRARRDHCNARGFVHAAILSALLDVVTGRNCVAAGGSEHSFVTVNLNVDFLAAARDGNWLTASARVTRVGRKLAFADGLVEVDGKPVAKASAVFAVA
jgi:acyl-coenzyme A thioesterase 13